MYYEHFRLSGPPFDFNPSASALFMSAGHREALAALEWGLREPSGFTMLVGEIGTGKTTLIYSLLAAQHQGVRTAWVANPRLSFEEMLLQILGQLGSNQSAKLSKLTLLRAFDAQLSRLRPDECIAVIIDEAQDLSDDALEDFRLLSNFQSLERRRLQIVLVGQLDLGRRLAKPEMRQLNQRIGARALLPTLSSKETYDYVDYRLRSRGGDIKRLFTHGAMRELSRGCGGIPRRINVLCHNAMFLAFAQGEESVTAQHMRDALHDYDHLLADKELASTKIAASASAAVHSAGAAVRSAAHGFGRKVTLLPPDAMVPAARSFAAGAARAAGAAFTFAALCLLSVMAVGFLKLQPVRNDLSALAARFESKATSLSTPIVVERPSAQISHEANRTAVPAPNAPGIAPVNVHGSTAASASALKALKTRDHTRGTPGYPVSNRPVPKDQRPETSAATNITPVSLPSVAPGSDSADEAAPQPETVMVRAGDTLSKIAMRLYGGSYEDDQLRAEVSQLAAANPQIKNANVIYPGQSIRVNQATTIRELQAAE
jgi:type II secretory pathway predicted ATPase ExeA/nucleoid-associated protein YgaU